MSDLLVLCYHAVSERWPASLSVTPQALAAQLGFVVRRGYRGVTFTEAVTQEAEGRRVAVTFDDAYASVLGLAFPILERLGLTATVFVPTAFVDSGRLMSWPGVDVWLGTEHKTELAGMSWEALGQLAEQGWEIGSHTRTHARLPDVDDAALPEELRESKQACERELGTPCRAIAYPYGAVDDRVVAAAAAAGYVAGAALPGSFANPAPLRWPRVGVFHKDGIGRFRLKASSAVRYARRSPAWTALERVRRR
jgi:peptidoglycan/xylan/chitin deacetylase (PgdA/CDA1 family)